MGLSDPDQWSGSPASLFPCNAIDMKPIKLLGLALLCLLSGSCYAQISVSPSIVDFSGGSLDSAYTLSDSTFCKGSVIAVRGSNFASTAFGETFDSISVNLGGLPCILRQTTFSPFGNNDEILFEIPRHYQVDTCLQLSLSKHTSDTAVQYTYQTLDTLCLIGDLVELAYPDSSFCIGDANPIPLIFLSTDSSGVFSSPILNLLSNGEILLHLGTVGEDIPLTYTTTHPVCPDTAQRSIDLRTRMTAMVAISGSQSASYCPSGVVLADTSLFFPKGGRFTCSDSNLVVLDDSLGLFDLTNTPPGNYYLKYGVEAPCFDTASLHIEVLQPDSVAVTYPVLYQGSFQPVCQNEASIVPLFQAGLSGGSFAALPNTLSLDSNGVIDPILSQPGNYAITYVSAGNCPDTVIAALNLRIDSIPDAGFSLIPSTVCGDDSFLSIDTLNIVGGVFNIWQDSLIHTANTPAIPVSGVLPPNQSYLIQHIVQGSGNCADTAYDYVTVVQVGDPSFAYAPSFYCFGDNDPVPIISGIGGGIFQALTQGTSLDSIGRLDLNASGAGVHVVQYTTPGACPDSLCDTITINNSVNAFFAYPASAFCSTDSNPVPQIASQGGVFSGNIQGIVLDSMSGEINLGSSQPGLYEVQYSFVGTCQTSFSTTIQILDFPGLPQLQYPADSFCRDSVPPIPALNTDSAGIFIGSLGVSFLNPLEGSLDLSNIPAGGPYTVRYDIGNPCAIDPIDTFYIAAKPNLSIHYPKAEACVGDPNTSPLIELTPVFALHSLGFSSQAGLVMDSAGTIYPNHSQPGHYQITYQTGNYCPAKATTELSVYPKPQGTRLTIEPDTILCEGDGFAASLTATDGISFSFLLNSILIDSTFYRIEKVSAQDNDVLAGIIENAFGCRDTLFRSFEVKPRPMLQINPPSGTVMDVGDQTITLNTSLSNTTAHWRLWYYGSIDDSGQVASFGPTLPNRISFDMTAQGLDPARYTLEILPSAEGCDGDTLFADYMVLEDRFFIPEVFTPNGDGQNDEWRVFWQDGTIPTGFEMVLFNRSGGEVHRMDAAGSWDGGRVPDGVYWWRLSDVKKQELQTGGLTIRRK